MATPNKPKPKPSPTSSPIPLSIINDEPALVKYILHTYARTPFDAFANEGYVDFAYTVENWRWDAAGHGESYPLTRKMMDRLWVRVVLEFWMRMAWCWEGGDVEGVVIALLEVSL